MAGARTILVVEDETVIRDAVSCTLVEEGWSVLVATTGDEALGLIEEAGHLDALFTDIRLPGTANGWDVAKAFRARHEHGIVIYATGYSDLFAPVDGSLFFRKPYRMAKLVQALDMLVAPEPQP